VEALVKAAKRSFKFIFNDHRISPAEFMTVCSQAASYMNERPLGVMSDTEEGISILTPNCLLLGRPYGNWGGNLCHNSGHKSRLQLVETICQRFWDRWVELYAPTLVKQSKWHKSSIDLKPGDVVVVSDSNSLRGQYYIARVKEVYPGPDGKVRRVSLAYKNFKVNEKVYEYKGSPDTTIVRSVHRLGLLVPAAVDGETDSSSEQG
jgi:hypothetical protein